MEIIVEFGILTICFIQLFLMVAFILRAVKEWGGDDENEKPKRKRKQKKEQATNDHGSKTEKRNTHKRSC